MIQTRALLAVGIASALFTAGSVASATPAAPSGAHPRVWLTPQTLGAMKSKVSVTGSAAARVVQECEHILLPEKASELTQAGIQGYNWAYSSATCGLAWQLTGNVKYAAPAVTLFEAMLDDYATLGDGAGGDTVVTHDTGYGMRFFGAYAGLAYDWLYDAPGVDGTVKAHARARFKAWNDWYATSGYLNDTPGSNYHAGYVFAKTIIAIAESGEDGANSAALWADVTDKMFPTDFIAKGLAPKGALSGGDWPEGWQYGAMSVLDYALAARALEEQGVSFPAVRAWTDSLAVRYVHAMNPAMNGQFVSGDLDDPRVDAPLNPRALIATIAGPSSPAAASWAAQVKAANATDGDICPVYDALAEARGAAAVDFRASSPDTTYIASGTRNLYTRSSWAPTATQAVFTSAPRLVPDHQHFDASNFVMNHGADHLVVDPSPYGSRSSLTANAMTVDSKVVRTAYAPSQSPFGEAEMPWARATKDGIAAARGELGGAFTSDDAPSDVGFARRDWTFLPEGEIVTIDRVRTDDAARNAYLRFRTPASMTLSGNVARGAVGASQLAIHSVALSGGTPRVQPVTVGECWDSNAYGQCAKGRFSANEYTVTLPGPKAYAVHVLDALGAGESPADVVAMSDASVDLAGQNAGVLGASVSRGGKRTFVLASNAETAQSLSTMTYGVPAEGATRHVVFDAPENASGGSTVATKVAAGRCVVTITPGAASAIAGHPLIFSVTSAADGCRVNDSAPAATNGAPSGTPAAGGAPGSSTSTDGTTPSPSGGVGGATPASGGSDSVVGGDAPGTGAGALDAESAGGANAGGCSAAPTGRTGTIEETWSALAVLVGGAIALQGRRRRRSYAA